MDNHDPTAAYENILGGKLHTPKVEDSSDDADEVEANKAAGGRRFIPKLMKVMQLTDHDGNQHLVGFESYKPAKAPQKRRDDTDPEPFKEYAILLKVVMQQYAMWGSKVDLRLEIQSEGLQNIFRTYAARYKELNLDSDPIVIEYPFRCLFFLRNKFVEIAAKPTTPADTRNELSQLLDFIRSPYGVQKFIDVYDDLVSEKRITFQMLWSIFPPLEPVILADRHENDHRGGGYLVESITLTQKNLQTSWNLRLLYGYHNGDEFSIRAVEHEIESFAGKREISLRQLSVVPLHLIEEQQRKSIWTYFVDRGKKYVEYCRRDSSFLHYKGPVMLSSSDNKMRLGDWGSSGVIDIDERVVIDRTAEHQVAGFRETYDDYVANSITEYIASANKDEDVDFAPAFRHNHLTFRELSRLDSSFQDSSDRSQLDRPEKANIDLDTALEPKKVKFTDDDYFICRNVIVGFALDQKAWVYNIRISRLEEINWDSDPFKLLQLGVDAKQLVYRLVKGFNSRKDDTLDDVIKSKGKGLIFLLHGPPGLGKTLTAESVAESARRPLYRITTGELSTDVEKLESQLSNIFRLGARWKAVVLLDEADVLMSKRTTQDLRRNSIVAVFLRLLEYYKGMLFLTTNRHDDFDEAFYSRIHVTIEYGGLIPEWRTNIWREHISNASRPNRTQGLWTEGVFEALGRIQANGRDIKNYTRTAYAFARAEDEDLTLHHVLVVLKNNLPEKAIKQHREAFAMLDGLDKKQKLAPPVEVQTNGHVVNGEDIDE